MQVRYGLLLRHTGVQSFDAFAEFENVLRCAEGMGASWGAVLLTHRSPSRQRRLFIRRLFRAQVSAFAQRLVSASAFCTC
jgi:hypothetical protein